MTGQRLRRVLWALCLLVARYIYDVMPLRRWSLPMMVFLVSLVLIGTD